MANKILKAIEIKNSGSNQYFTDELVTREEISEYINIVLDTVKKMKFKTEDMKANVAKIFEVGIRPEYVADSRALGAAYCLITDDRFGKLEINENYLNIYACSDLCLEIANTIIHEIAHFVAGSAHGHDNTWNNTCVRIAKALAKEGYFEIKQYYFCFSSSSYSIIPQDPAFYVSISGGEISFANTHFSREKLITPHPTYGVAMINEEDLIDYIKVPNLIEGLNMAIKCCKDTYAGIFGEEI